MDYISIAEAAAKWGITRCRVQVLCDEGRIPGLMKFGNPCDVFIIAWRHVEVIHPSHSVLLGMVETVLLLRG